MAAKILLFDIETRPMLGYVWSLFDNDVALNQLHTDWHVISFAAKWLGDSDKKIIYHDQRNSKNIEDDKQLLKKIWKLLDEADVVITQNGIRFDVKKLNARFIFHKFKPPSPFKHMDTLVMAKSKFAFTSNKLEYLSSVLCPEQVKMKSKKFPGFELWKECLRGNLAAWKELELYNKQDIRALEGVYHKLAPWTKTVDLNLFYEGADMTCICGHKKFMRKGFHFSPTGQFQRYKCKKCGKAHYSKENLLSSEKKKSLKRYV